MDIAAATILHYCLYLQLYIYIYIYILSLQAKERSFSDLLLNTGKYKKRRFVRGDCNISGCDAVQFCAHLTKRKTVPEYRHLHIQRRGNPKY